QDHVVIEPSSSHLSFVVSTAALRSTAVAADPDVSLVIDGDPVVRIRPIVALARTTPMPEEVPGWVEFKNGRSRRTTLGDGRVRRCVQFSWLKRTLPMNDPYMVLGIDRNTD